MQKITPCIWYNDNAQEAVEFYSSIFNNAKTISVSKYDEASAKVSGQPEGSVLVIEFEIEGQRFSALNGGPLFKINPSISFLVVCKTKEEVNNLWNKLSKGGEALMPLDKYPFSEWYGWTVDKFGVSWQVYLADEHYAFKQKITPTLMFVGDVAGRAEEAMKFYASLFPESKLGSIARYPKGMEPEKEGTVMHGAVTLAGQEFFAMDSAADHKFNFNEGVSLMIDCKDQKEVDHYWNKFTEEGEESQCGWLKDKFGVSWQVTPTILNEMLMDKDQKKAQRAMKAMLEMKKIDISELKKAFEDK